jgi:Na+/proline symporter
MTGADWSVLGLYLVIVVGMSFSLARRQAAPEDYFLGGRKIPSEALAGSIRATQVSAVSMIGAPEALIQRFGGRVERVLGRRF